MCYNDDVTGNCNVHFHCYSGHLSDFTKLRICSHTRKSQCAPVAQLDRAFACGAKGRRFESCRVYHINKQKLRMEFIFVDEVS